MGQWDVVDWMGFLEFWGLTLLRGAPALASEESDTSAYEHGGHPAAAVHVFV
jgi:hypothetical protein